MWNDSIVTNFIFFLAAYYKKALKEDLYLCVRSDRKISDWIMLFWRHFTSNWRQMSELVESLWRPHVWIHCWWRMQQCRDESEIYERFPFNPKFWIGASNGTSHFGLFQSKYSGPALKVVHFDRSGNFGWPDRNVPFHLTKLLSPVPLFCILLTRIITKRAVVTL